MASDGKIFYMKSNLDIVIASGPVEATPKPDLITQLAELRALLPSIPPARLKTMEAVTARYQFRLPRFYIERILRDDPTDPLWDLVLPGEQELTDAGDERWDAFQLQNKAVEHPRWIQKYRYEALIRTTDYCSGLCRYCYLKNRDVTPGTITLRDIDDMFDQLAQSPHAGVLRELILSGGDPLAVSASVLEHFALRLEHFNRSRRYAVTVSIHTREPVWFPQRLMRSTALQAALSKLGPSSHILHLVHPREVTTELIECIELLHDLGQKRTPLIMMQHPLFRGINDDPNMITDMYMRVDAGRVPVKPYYLIHPFPDGTLPQHRLMLPESQAILRALASAPGTRVPLLTVPTPMGKCVIGPYERLEDRGSYYLLHTKDGVPVEYAIGQHYNPAEYRPAIPAVPLPMFPT
jgi:L-lysine 2,3-aminomutase